MQKLDIEVTERTFGPHVMHDMVAEAISTGMQVAYFGRQKYGTIIVHHAKSPIRLSAEILDAIAEIQEELKSNLDVRVMFCNANEGFDLVGRKRTRIDASTVLATFRV